MQATDAVSVMPDAKQPSAQPVALPRRIHWLALIALVVLADFLLFQGDRWGLALALTATALGSAIALSKPDRSRLVAAGFAAAAVLPLFEAVTPLSVLIALAGLTVSALWRSGGWDASPYRWTIRLVWLPLSSLWRLWSDLARTANSWTDGGYSGSLKRMAALWAMPLILTAGFLILLADANPLIDRALAAIDIAWLIDRIDVERLVFWTAAAALFWPFIHARLPNFLKSGQSAGRGFASPREDVAGGLIAAPSILRALILFNLLFAVQTASDLAYLWGGLALPEGMTFAGYAHRGAYPLIVTALLAAGFVLLALRSGSTAAASPLIRRLVYLWVGQNVLLVLSSIFRLDLYVSVYALTYWRIAAFLWMALVAFGLCAIVARILWNKSSRWLVWTNLGAAAAMLYAVSFVNLAGVIGDWNVRHSAEAGGPGVSLDVWYLSRLGAGILPSLNDALVLPLDEKRRDVLSQAAANRKHDLEAQLADWRGWSFRSWRLQRTLDTQPLVNPNRPETGDLRPQLPSVPGPDMEGPQ